MLTESKVTQVILAVKLIEAVESFLHSHSSKVAQATEDGDYTMTTNETNTAIKLENTGKIVLPQIDVTKYIGKSVKIVSVTEHKGNIKGQDSYYVRFESEVLETIGTGDKAFELKASRIVGLQVDDNGTIGWGDNTVMDLLLKKYKVDHYNQMVGVQVIVQTKTAKDGKDYLTF